MDKQAFDNFGDQMLNSAINGINEAVAQERKKTEWWKRQAYILHSAKGRCRSHNHQVAVKDADLYFAMGGAICPECSSEDNKKPKEVNHA